MKAIMLVSAMMLVFLVLMTLLLRLTSVRRRALLLTRLWLLSLPLLGLLYALTPPDVWVLPLTLLDDPPWFGPWFSVGIWCAGFFGGLLQLYNLAERGMSLRMLIDIARADPTGLTAGEIISGYSDGQSVAWMYKKRLDGLQQAHLVEVEDHVVVLLPRGRRTATAFGTLRRFLRLGLWT
jgi:hypothetical protein